MSKFEKTHLNGLEPVSSITTLHQSPRINWRHFGIRAAVLSSLIGGSVIGFGNRLEESRGKEELTASSLEGQHTSRHYTKYLELVPEVRQKYCSTQDSSKLKCDWIINPLGESTKIFVPGMPVLEYFDLLQYSRSNDSDSIPRNENLARVDSGTNKQVEKSVVEVFGKKHRQESELSNQVEIVSEVVWNLVKEELWSENLLVYIAALIPEVQHFLFFILVSKARLTTNVLRKLQKSLDNLDQGLTKLLQKTKYSSKEVNITPSDIRLKDKTKSQPSRVEGFFGFGKVIDEIQVLRGLLSQVKIALQAPMMLAKTGSLTQTYLGMTDFANPRFSSIFLPNPNSDNVFYKNVYGEKDVEAVWNDCLQKLHSQDQISKSRTGLFWQKSGYNGSSKASLVDYAKPNSVFDIPTKIQSEHSIGNVERIAGYQDYYGSENIEKLRLLYLGLESIAKVVFGARGNNDKTTFERLLGQRIESKFPNPIDHNLFQKTIQKYRPNTNWNELL